VDNINFEEDNVKDIETKDIIEDKAENSQTIINQTKNDKNYFVYLIPVGLLLAGIAFYSISGADTSKNHTQTTVEKTLPVKEPIIEVHKEKEEQTLENEVLAKIDNKETKKEIKEVEKIVNEKIEKEEAKKEIVKEDTYKKVTPLLEKKAEEKKALVATLSTEEKEKLQQLKKEAEEKELEKEIQSIIESTSTSETALNKLENLDKTKVEKKTIKKSSIVTKSLNDISKYIKKMKYKNKQILFQDNYYKENDVLLGFKIFKITPIYVKFEDTKKNIRKRYLFKK